MKKLIICLLCLATLSFADGCYFLSQMEGIEKPTRLKKINCDTVNSILEDFSLYESRIGREGWIIMDKGIIQYLMRVFDSYYTSTTYHNYFVYMTAQMRGGNPLQCKVATSTGPNCSAFEYVMLGIAIRDYFLKK